MPRHTEINLGFCHLSACAASVAYSIPSAGERESRSPEPLVLAILYGRGRIRFLGSAPRDCSRSSSRLVSNKLPRLGGTGVVNNKLQPLPHQEELPLPLFHLHRNRTI